MIELLLTIAIIGILASILIPQLLDARDRAIDSGALAYAREVYHAANVHLTQNDATALTPTDCTSGFAIGDVSVDPPNSGIESCDLFVAADDSFSVQVVSTTTRIFEFP